MKGPAVRSSPVSSTLSHHRWIASLLLFFGMVIAAAAPASAQLGPPSKDLWARWTKSAKTKTVNVDHSAYASFLKRNLVRGSDGIIRVRYSRVSSADKTLLNRYIRQMEGVNVDKLTRPQQMAYWINLYNAKTVDLVIEAYPVKSIRNVRSVLTLGPWDDKVLKVRGTAISLNDIEHRILRPIWKDVRIHYAVNCASLGCPNLATRPYTAARLNLMLEAAARDFINSPRAFSIRGGKLHASSIFNWYQSDWGSNANAVLRHARRYGNAVTRAKLKGRTTIDDYDYDWSLNLAR
ncbi:MAG: DUF547 domain-containing protein [Pseudomonadota bacterium]